MALRSTTMDFAKVYDDAAVHASSLLIRESFGTVTAGLDPTTNFKNGEVKAVVKGQAFPFLPRTLSLKQQGLLASRQPQRGADDTSGDAIRFPPPTSSRSKSPRGIPKRPRTEVDLLYRLFRRHPTQPHDGENSPRRNQRWGDTLNYEEYPCEVRQSMPPEWIDTSTLMSPNGEEGSSRKRHRAGDHDEDYWEDYSDETGVAEESQSTQKTPSSNVKDGQERSKPTAVTPASSMQTRSAALTSKPPPTVSFYYCYASPDGSGAVLVEKRKDEKCPFCGRHVSTEAELLTHLSLLHGDCFKFKSTKDRQSNLHVAVNSGFDSMSRKGQKPSQLKDFVHVQSVSQRQKRKSLSSGVPNPSSTSDAHSPRIDFSLDFPIPDTAAPTTESVGGSCLPFVPIRQYFHSRTNLPMLDGDWDRDSDDEPDNGWLHRLGDKLLDDFDDVSKKEKEFMKLWNRFIKSHTITPDRVVPDKCMAFVNIHAQELAKHGLRQQLLLHLLNLWDFGVISNDHILQCMGQYDAAVPSLQKKNGSTVTSGKSC